MAEQSLRDKINALIQHAPGNVRERVEEDIQRLYAHNIESDGSLLCAINNSSLPTQIREIACWLTARIGDEDSVSALLTASSDPISSIRRSAIQALGELNIVSPQVMTRVQQALFDDRDVEVRKIAAYALGLLADSDGLNPLMNVLGNKNEQPSVRGMAAESLINFYDRSTIPLLITALSDEAPEVRCWSAFALG